MGHLSALAELKVFTQYKCNHTYTYQSRSIPEDPFGNNPRSFSNHNHHHHQPINVPSAGAQAFLMDHPQ
jgi:hypothetical protein